MADNPGPYMQAYRIIVARGCTRNSPLGVSHCRSCQIDMFALADSIEKKALGGTAE